MSAGEIKPEDTARWLAFRKMQRQAHQRAFAGSVCLYGRLIPWMLRAWEPSLMTVLDMQGRADIVGDEVRAPLVYSNRTTTALPVTPRPIVDAR